MKTGNEKKELKWNNSRNERGKKTSTNDKQKEKNEKMLKCSIRFASFKHSFKI